VESGSGHNASAIYDFSLLSCIQADDIEVNRIKSQPFIPLGVARGFSIKAAGVTKRG
jgi:hypothetical protein